MLQLVRQPRVEILFDQIARTHKRLLRILAKRFGKKAIRVVAEGTRLPAPATNAETDRGWLVLLIEITQRRGGRARLGERRVEEARQILFGVPRDRELFKPLLTAVDEHEEVAIARVGARRSDILRQRVVVEFLVHHDPHADLMAPHHRQQQRMSLGEPVLTNRNLLRPWQQGGRLRHGVWLGCLPLHDCRKGDRE